MQIASIIEAAGQYVKAQYQQHPNPNLVYHDLTHTQQVVEAAEQIAAHYRLQEQDQLVVMVAAWFHDAGYLLGNAKGHEEKGAELARSFLQEQHLPESVQQQVSGCIMATKMPQNPHNLLEEIVCDADLFHLGSKHYKERSKAMRQEAEATLGKDIPGGAWAGTSLLFLENHQYFTDYARVLLKEQKEDNIRWLKKKMHKKHKDEDEVVAEATPKHLNSSPVSALAEQHQTKEEKKKEDKKEKDKEAKKADKFGRGVETMFRTTSTNHIRLSSMADSKAHIMISTNAIIISILLSVLLRKLEDNPNLIIPSFILLATSVITIIYSVLATRPNITNGRFTRDDIEKKKTNLLFFGNFHGMTLEEYGWGMTEMMKDANFLYGSLIQDIYHLGVVLGQKYRLLRIAYNIFMWGLIISVLAFVIAVVFFPVKD